MVDYYSSFITNVVQLLIIKRQYVSDRAPSSTVVRNVLSFYNEKLNYVYNKA